MTSVAAILLGIVPAVAQAQPAHPGPMHDRWTGWMPFYGGFGWILALAVLVAVVVLILSLVRGSGSARSSARDRLDERYASGEIDREEYMRRKRDLSGR